MRKIIGTFLITVSLIIFSATFVSAESSSTIDAVNAYLMMLQFDSYFSTKDSPTTSSFAGEESINEVTGGLTLKKTDLTLPGKGGNDLNITRNFNTSMPIDQNSDIYYVSVGNYLTVREQRDSCKYLFKYYVNGQADEVVYIAYDSIKDMLNAENGTNKISVGTNYADYPEYRMTTEENYYTTYERVNDIGFVFGDSTYYLYSELPVGDGVDLTRDIYAGYDIINLHSIYNYEFSYKSSTHDYYSNNGWIFDVPMIQKICKSISDDSKDLLELYYTLYKNADLKESGIYELYGIYSY